MTAPAAQSAAQASSGEEQQHLLTGNIERTKTIVALDSFESEDAFIKDYCAVQLIDI